MTGTAMAIPVIPAVFISVPQLALYSVRKNCAMYVETNAVCGSAGNEATVHCVLLNLHAWIQKSHKLLVQILQVKYVQGLREVV